jgi:hypothetical protein
MALKEIFEANEFHIEEDRTTLNQLVDIFFPLLEQVMMEAGQSSSGNQILVMHLISKIFFSANNVSVSLILTLCSLWLRHISWVCPNASRPG